MERLEDKGCAYTVGIINRWYEILELFLAHDRLSEEELEEKLHLTPYTIKNNIKLLNNELQGIAWIQENGKNYHIKIKDFKQLEKIMTGSFKKESDFNSSSKRIAYLIRELFLTKEYKVIMDFAEELSVSRNTVNNDLKTARDQLKEYDVEIKSTTGKGIRLVGDSLDIRLVYINLVQDYFDFLFISEKTLNQIYQLTSDYNVDKETVNLLIKTIDASIGALKYGYNLKRSVPFYNNAIEDTPLSKEIIYIIENNYNISLSQYEIDFINYPLNLNNFHRIDKKHRADQNYLANIFNRMVERIEDSFVIDIDRDTLFDEIANHLYHLINRTIFHVRPREMFFGEVEEEYPFSYEVAKVAVSSIENDIHHRIDSTEIDFLTLYFEMALRDTKSSRSLNIAIISNSGLGTTNIIRRQIESVVGMGTRFTHFTEVEYLEEDLTDFFVVFTSIPIENPPVGVPIIRLSNILSDQWLSEELGKVISTNPKLIQSTLYDVYKLNSNKNYIDNVLFLVEELERAELVNKEFKQRIIDREKTQLTVFDNGIAFPHEVNPESDQIFMAVGIFNEDYRINDKEINLIILLAVPENLIESNEQNLIELYDLIFRLANDYPFREDIRSIESKTDFIEYIENRRLPL